MRKVIIESPFAGDIKTNLRYLRRCLHDSIVNHNEAPFASHGLYTQDGVLDDNIPIERQLGILAGFAWKEVADETIVYTDYGISRGMQFGIDHAKTHKKWIEYRQIGSNPISEDDNADH